MLHMLPVTCVSLEGSALVWPGFNCALCLLFATRTMKIAVCISWLGSQQWNARIASLWPNRAPFCLGNLGSAALSFLFFLSPNKRRRVCTASGMFRLLDISEWCCQLYFQSLTSGSGKLLLFLKDCEQSCITWKAFILHRFPLDKDLHTQKRREDVCKIGISMSAGLTTGRNLLLCLKALLIPREF